MNSAFLIWALPCWPPSAEKEARRALTIHPANRLESLFTVQSLLTDESAFTGIVLTNNTKRSPQQQWGFHWSSFEDLKKQQIGFFFFKSCLKKKINASFLRQKSVSHKAGISGYLSLHWQDKNRRNAEHPGSFFPNWLINPDLLCWIIKAAVKYKDRTQ